MKEVLQRRQAMAARKQPADLVLKNGKVIDVFQLKILDVDVAIGDGYIVGLGAYDGVEEIDVSGKYICPALIDGHVHIEAAMVTPEQFAKVLVPKGVTCAITDPHEIANVGGMEAIEYMLRASRQLPLQIHMMAPSSVPATSFEHSGAHIDKKDIQHLFTRDDVFGLGEVMDYPAVFSGDEEMMSKLSLAHMFQKPIDGHAAGLDEIGLNTYRTVGITNDHEATSKEEALARLERGMYVLLREGTAAKDVKALLPAVTAHNARRHLFATDGKNMLDLLDEGSIDANVRLAIQLGMDPLQAIQLATLNAAECFSLKERGAIAPGYVADLILLQDIEKFIVNTVYVKGKKVATNDKLTTPLRQSVQPPSTLTNSMNVKPFSKQKLQLPITNPKNVHVIEAVPGSLVTNHLIEEVKTKDGLFVPSVSKNQLKLVVAERHKRRGTVGVGVVKGIPLTDGALVSTFAHDSHNIVACGTDDESIYFAMQHTIDINGGLAVVRGNEVLASLPLPLAGLMSLQSAEEVYKSLQEIKKALPEIGFLHHWDPFLTLSFLALPVIPTLKLTDQGLFHVPSFQHIKIDQQHI